MDQISRRDIYDVIAELDRPSNPQVMASSSTAEFASTMTPHAANQPHDQRPFHSTDTGLLQTDRRPYNFDE